MDSIKRCCGTCKSWTPQSTMEEILENKHKSMPLCKVTKEVKGPKAEAGCFFWGAAEDQELKRRAEAGFIGDDYICLPITT